MNNIIKENVLLSDYTSYKTGGPAKYFAEPKTNEELKFALNYAHTNNLKLEIIGGGSNLLISDEGFNGLIICTKKLNEYIINYENQFIKDSSLNDNSVILHCGAGINLGSFIDFAISKSYKGMENMSGIPGTLGGAVKMNAGAFGTEIKDVLLFAEVMDYKGVKHVVDNVNIQFGYRLSPGLVDKIVLGATFKFEISDEEELEKIKTDIISRRNEKQPLHRPSCGSVFKRPVGNYAGTLIEQCGLKGHRIGGAMVSEKHGNFILNEDNATSTDIKNLIDYIIKTVYSKTNVQLEPEVRMIGF